MIGSDTWPEYFFEIFINGFKISSLLCTFGFKCAALSKIWFLYSLSMIYKSSVNCQTATAPDSPAQWCLETFLARSSSVGQIQGKFWNTTISPMNKQDSIGYLLPFWTPAERQGLPTPHCIPVAHLHQLHKALAMNHTRNWHLSSYKRSNIAQPKHLPAL